MFLQTRLSWIWFAFAIWPFIAFHLHSSNIFANMDFQDLSSINSIQIPNHSHIFLRTDISFGKIHIIT
jgi:hypothetical protein